MVERQLPKLNVVGSIPIARSNALPIGFHLEQAREAEGSGTEGVQKFVIASAYDSSSFGLE